MLNVTMRTIQRWENDLTEPNGSQAQRIASVLNRDVASFYLEVEDLEAA